MDKFSLADLYEQDTVSPSGPQLTPSLADLYELSGAGTQQPPVVVGDGVSSRQRRIPVPRQTWYSTQFCLGQMHNLVSMLNVDGNRVTIIRQTI